MKASRCVRIIDDEARVWDALTLLLSTARIESRSYGSAEEFLTSNPLKEPGVSRLALRKGRMIVARMILLQLALQLSARTLALRAVCRRPLMFRSTSPPVQVN
jgi:FixJ family two-component response regulator